MTSRTRGTRSSGQRRSGPKRTLGWTSATGFNVTIPDGSLIVLDGLGALAADQKRDIRTILRTVGTFTARASSAGSFVGGRFGLIRVSNTAMVAPSVPNPLFDTENSWLFNKEYFQEDAANVPTKFEFDVHGMRRLLGDEQTIAISIGSSSISVGSALVSFGIRFLYSFN